MYECAVVNFLNYLKILRALINRKLGNKSECEKYTKYYI